MDTLKQTAVSQGAKDVTEDYASCDLALEFWAFPKVPVIVMFWDENEGFESQAKLLFDASVTYHLDIESIMFLSEHLCQMLLPSSS